MSIKIHQPHDSFVRRSLTNPEVAKDLLEPHIPSDIAQRINWDTFQLTSKSFVKEGLEQLHSDVVYQCEIGAKKAYIYVLLEHQSTPEKLLPFRILAYNVALMEQHLEQLSVEGFSKQLPIIINVCLYAGNESPYPYSRDIYDCFDDPTIARREMFKPIKLIDLTIISQEELLKEGKADLLEILLKQGIKRDFLKWIKENREVVARLFNRYYGESGILYILEVDDKNDSQVLLEAIIEAAPDKKNLIMTAAQQLRQQGMQQGLIKGIKEGLQQGIEQERLEIAKSMIKDGEPIEKITKWTGLSLDTIKDLAK